MQKYNTYIIIKFCIHLYKTTKMKCQLEKEIAATEHKLFLSKD